MDWTRFAALFWYQLFGSHEDDFGEWQSQTKTKCKCKTELISVKKMKLIRVQKVSDRQQYTRSMLGGTVGVLSMGTVDMTSQNEDHLVLYGIEMFCKCSRCDISVYYTVENSQRGKYFRCGVYGKQLKALREIQKRKSLTLHRVHKLYKAFNLGPGTTVSALNREWSFGFWSALKSEAQHKQFHHDQIHRAPSLPAAAASGPELSSTSGSADSKAENAEMSTKTNVKEHPQH